MENVHLTKSGSKRRFQSKVQMLSVVLMFFVVLLGDGNRGLVLPTLAGYLHKHGGNAEKLAMTKAGFSFGRMLVAPALGIWMDKRPVGDVLIATLCICIVSNMLYVFAGHFPGPWAVYMIMFSRTMVGVGACVLGIGRSYVSRNTLKENRTGVLSLLCATQFLGFTGFSCISLVDVSYFYKTFGLTKHTFPGAALAMFYAILLLFILILPTNFWDPPPKEQKKIQPKPDVEVAQSYGSIEQPRQLKEVMQNHAVELTSIGLASTFVLLNFTIRAILATQETLGTCVLFYLMSGVAICNLEKNPQEQVYLQEHENEITTRVAYFFTYLGLFGFVIFCGVYLFSKILSDRALLLIGLVITTVGLWIQTNFHDGSGIANGISLSTFETGFVIAWGLGYPFTQTCVVSALSKVLDPAVLGTWMGYQATAGSAGRIVAPLLAGYVFTKLHSETGFWPFFACLLASGICSVLVVVFWKRLKVE